MKPSYHDRLMCEVVTPPPERCGAFVPALRLLALAGGIAALLEAIHRVL